MDETIVVNEISLKYQEVSPTKETGLFFYDKVNTLRHLINMNTNGDCHLDRFSKTEIQRGNKKI